MKITYKVLLALVITIFGLLSITTTYELSRLRKKFEAESHDLHTTIAANLVENISAALFNVDRQRIIRQIQSAFQFGQIERVIVLDDTAKPVAVFQMKSSTATELTVSSAEDLGLETANFKNPRQARKDLLVDMIETEILTGTETQRLTTTLWFADDDRRIFVGHLILEFSDRAVIQAISQSIIDKLASAFFLAVIMCALSFLLLKVTILRRLETLRSSVRSIQSRDYSQPIAFKGKDEISALAQAFSEMVDEIRTYQMGLEDKVRERTLDLQKSRDKIKTILDNIGEGIITFAVDLSIDSEYSKKTLEILGVSAADLAGKSVFDSILRSARLSPDRLSQLHETFQCTLGSDELSWLVNNHALPTELEYFGTSTHKILGLEWIPLFDSNREKIDRVLLTIRDLTHLRLLEKLRLAEVEQNDRILTLVKVIRNMGIARITAFFKNSQTSIQKIIDGQQDKTSGLLLLHTLKGEARTLQLKNLADAAHDAESDLKNPDSEIVKLSLWRLHESITTYMDVLKILVHEDDQELRPSFFKIATQVIDDVAERAFQAGVHQGEISISSGVEVWDQKVLNEILGPCLIHALNNTLDHGYIFPETRYLEGRKLSLRVRAFQDDHAIRLEIQDEGYGIDPEWIAQKAKEKGLKVNDLSAEEIIFLHGFSTASQVSTSSGRGVGLAAIKALVEDAGGKIRLESSPGRGSTLTLTLPLRKNIERVA